MRLINYFAIIAIVLCHATEAAYGQMNSPLTGTSCLSNVYQAVSDLHSTLVAPFPKTLAKSHTALQKANVLAKRLKRQVEACIQAEPTGTEIIWGGYAVKLILNSTSHSEYYQVVKLQLDCAELTIPKLIRLAPGKKTRSEGKLVREECISRQCLEKNRWQEATVEWQYDSDTIRMTVFDRKTRIPFKGYYLQRNADYPLCVKYPETCAANCESGPVDGKCPVGCEEYNEPMGPCNELGFCPDAQELRCRCAPVPKSYDTTH